MRLLSTLALIVAAALPLLAAALADGGSARAPAAQESAFLDDEEMADVMAARARLAKRNLRRCRDNDHDAGSVDSSYPVGKDNRRHHKKCPGQSKQRQQQRKNNLKDRSRHNGRVLKWAKARKDARVGLRLKVKQVKGTAFKISNAPTTTAAATTMATTVTTTAMATTSGAAPVPCTRSTIGMSCGTGDCAGLCVPIFGDPFCTTTNSPCNMFTGTCNALGVCE